MSRKQQARDPHATAAQLVENFLGDLSTSCGCDGDQLTSSIDDVYAALGGDNLAEERDFYLYARASYLVGVQVGLRLRNVGGAR